MRTVHKIIVRCVHHFAVIGSGPSGFYCAKYLLEKLSDARVDIIEKLPVPYGLARYGVAPDHADVKSCVNTFREIANNPRLRFFGNINVGTDVSLAEIQSNYSATVLAYGAADDIFLNIKGEKLSNVHSARSFVSWYNGHPNYSHMGDLFNLSHAKNVVIIGQGNVALDCARILSKRSVDLESTDISSEARKHLEASAVRSVTLLGRRGHVQTSFTIKELRELSRLSNAKVIIRQAELTSGLTAASQVELDQSAPKKRLVALINSLADTSTSSIQEISTTEPNRIINIRFLLSPIEILEDESDYDRGSAVLAEMNVLEGEPHNQRTVGTGDTELLPCDLVLKSVGYKSVPMPGAPFDSTRNVIPNSRGRVCSSSVAAAKLEQLAGSDSGSDDKTSCQVKGLYVSGWLKRGPNGIIATNVMDAKETVTSLVHDLQQGMLGTGEAQPDPVEHIGALCRHDVVQWRDYLKIDQQEVAAGQACHPPKPRNKLLTKADMLRAAHNH